jgi:co-chaperonin GroES (HSP10)
MSVVISKPRPLFRRALKESPAHPLGNRVLVREFPVESKSEGGLETPDVAKTRYFAGTLVAAGDQAADRLYDLGVEIGDEVWYGKYAGLIQEWQHITGPDDPACLHQSTWDYVAKTDPRWVGVGEPNDNLTLRECRACGTLKVTERMIVLSVDDIVLDVDLQERLESGLLVRRRGETADGRTRYYLERPPGRPDAFESPMQTDDETEEEAA